MSLVVPIRRGSGVMDMTASRIAIARGEWTAEAAVRVAAERIEDRSGEGMRVFTRPMIDEALRAAQDADAGAPGELAGLPVTVKDMFDVVGQRTSAGSAALFDAPPAKRDAVAVSRLRAAGAAIIGRSNMTEFAFSGLGINPHFGTPANPWDRAAYRIPGGSTSGGAVAVADGMALASLGSDTGGSCRIPAALCGITGFKPTARRIPREGCFPLSASQDSIGVLTRSVRDVVLLDSVLTGEEARPAGATTLRVPRCYLIEGLTREVAADFGACLSLLSAGGISVFDLDAGAFDAIPARLSAGNLVGAEAYRVHAALLAKRAEAFDPRVGQRIALGAKMTRDEYFDLQAARQSWQALWQGHVATGEMMIVPTVPTIAPRIADLQADEALYFATNATMLRNPTLVNLVDGCAISLPMHHFGSAPTGLMLMAGAGQDRALLATAERIEALLQAANRGLLT